MFLLDNTVDTAILIMALVSLTPLPEIVISSLYVLLLTLTLSTMTDIFVTDTVAHLTAVTAALLTDTVVTRLFWLCFGYLLLSLTQI